jgi:hypothetical protein
VTVLDKEARNGQSRMEQRRDYNMETYYWIVRNDIIRE